MLIPSIDILNLLTKANTGVWPERLSNGAVALVVKLPQSIIKKIYRGAKCKLVTAVINVERFKVLYLGFTAYDDTVNPFTIIQPVATVKSQSELREITKCSSVKLFIFDELSHPLLEADCEFDSRLLTKAYESIIRIRPYALDATLSIINDTLKFSREVESGIDLFQNDLNSIRTGTSSVAEPATNHVIPLTLVIAEPQEKYAVNAIGDSVEVTLTQEDEGNVFEQLIHFSMNELYQGQSFHQPIVKISQRERELADLISIDYDKKIISLIQAKAIAGLQVKVDQSKKKRSASTEKQVRKALKQLTGAIRQIRAGNQVLDSNHNHIQIPDPEGSLIHAIILVSELYPFADWKSIGDKLLVASNEEKYKALFHVLDLLELQHLAVNSKSSDTFHNYLLQRWIMVKKTGTAYVRGRTKRPYDDVIDTP